jgi:hypothetical protein
LVLFLIFLHRSNKNRRVDASSYIDGAAKESNFGGRGEDEDDEEEEEDYEPEDEEVSKSKKKESHSGSDVSDVSANEDEKVHPDSGSYSFQVMVS